jgi:predicted ATP-grasp superfamily ATP-dependent carboligase
MNGRSKKQETSHPSALIPGPSSLAPHLVILGASTRAAAFSALRAEMSPICGDLFADKDLVSRCPVTRVRAGAYPNDLERIAGAAPAAPWLYVGALENRPDLVDRVSAQRPLWGNDGSTLRRVRDPIEVADCLRRAGITHPRVRPSSDGLPTDGSWLIKPRAGSAGRGIHRYVGDVGSVHRPVRQPEVYYQEFIAGDSVAAVFVANRESASLIGLTRQLVGEPAMNARPFHYCGTIGPIPMEPALRRQLERLGQTLARAFGLQGLFGVDGVLNDGTFWPVEVNPRYAASVEVLELALGVPLLAVHRDACTSGTVSWTHWAAGNGESQSVAPMVGKAILFARDAIEAPDLTPMADRAIGGHRGRLPIPEAADIPAPGEHIPAGAPVCSVFSIGATTRKCFDGLTRAADHVLTVPTVSSNLQASRHASAGGSFFGRGRKNRAGDQ